MKLNYDQMRQLAQLGQTDHKLVIKNKKGVVLKPAQKKWDPSPKEIRSTCLAVQQKPSHAVTANRFLTCPQITSYARLQGKARQ